MTSFVALYRGRTIGDATIIAASADDSLVSLVASRLLRDTNTDSKDHSDPVVSALDCGRRRALRLIAGDRNDKSG